MDREPHPSGMDKADFDDFDKAEPFRKLAEEWDESAASLAHRYALSTDKVGSVILGIKNREELIECLDAEKRGNLSEEQMNILNNLF
jgi:aryl-alcohol dehydrogenase-like predicted oxidoreductase